MSFNNLLDAHTALSNCRQYLEFSPRNLTLPTKNNIHAIERLKFSIYRLNISDQIKLI